MSYAVLLDSLHRGVAEGPPTDLPGELDLQARWFAGHFGRNFTTPSGEKIRIVQFGEWNRGAGPDFLHAVIEFDGGTRHGPLELDLEPADWETHGHATNPAFDETILHVVFRDPPAETFTRSSRNTLIPRLRIPDTLIRDALQLPTSRSAIAHPGRCVKPLAQLTPTGLHSLLREATTHRSRIKASRFLQTADAHGRDAALWQATAETLGYRANALPLKLLAQRLPIPTLRQHPEAIAALLFGTAGFLSADLHEKAPPDTRSQLRQLWDTWWKHRPSFETAHPIPWKSHGQRPANHPHRRVATLASLLQNWPKFRQLALARPFDPMPLISHLQSLADPFWTHRHTLTSAPAARPIALFGKSRALELLANHLVPLALLEDPHFSYEKYLKLPASTPNENVRRCAIRLFGSEETAKPWLNKTAHHQALLQIYHDFCLEDLSDCQACPFPEQLAQWQ